MAGVEPWTTLLEERGAALVLFARQWAYDRADAEDIVQEAFVRFWPSRHKAVDAPAYLFACVRSCALEWLRGNRRRVRRELLSGSRDVAGGELFESAVEHDERRAVLESKLMELPGEQREVLVLKIWGELSFPQIATTLGISPNTAASRYRYALAKLRAQLTEETIR
jgi:RNA polymerase sigma-70 factor (ECF subfamily)